MTKEADDRFLKAVGHVIQAQVQLAVAPLLVKIKTLEDQIGELDKDDVHIMNMIDQRIAAIPSVEVLHGRDGADGKDGRDGTDCSMEAVIERVDHFLLGVKDGQDGKDGKDGRDGKDCDWHSVNEQLSTGVQMLREELKKYVDELPKSKDGRDGVDGKDGISIDPKTVDDLIVATVETALEKWPRPRDGVDGKDGKDGKDGSDGDDGVDGKSVSIDELGPVIDARVRDSVASLPAPRHVVSGSIDRDGGLHLVLSDGQLVPLGKVVGRDGKDGTNGKDGADGGDGPPGKDGRDGADGLGFEDMSMSFDGERDFVFKYERGELVKEFAVTVPFQLYRNVWKAGEYKRGDTVTRDGSQWVATRDTDAQPGTVDSGWQLSVKRGRDGKDGKDGVGERGPPGPPGKDGRDLTQIGPDGKKWG